MSQGTISSSSSSSAAAAAALDPNYFFHIYKTYTDKNACPCAATTPIRLVVEPVHELRGTIPDAKPRTFGDPIIISHALIAIAPFLWIYITLRNWRLHRTPNDGLYPVALSMRDSVAVIGFLFLSLLFSIRYHLTRECKGHRADVMFALAVFILNLYLLQKTSVWSKVAATIIGVCSILVFSYSRYNYDTLHPAWHWMAGIVVLILALDFL